jgi:hypothetical protein
MAKAPSKISIQREYNEEVGKVWALFKKRMEVAQARRDRALDKLNKDQVDAALKFAKGK